MTKHKSTDALGCPGSPQVMEASLTFGVYAVCAIFALERFDFFTALQRGAIVFTSVAAFAWFIVAWVRAVRRLDEMQKSIQLEALAVAFPLAVMLVFTLGFLERAGFEVPGFRDLRDVWPLAVFPYFLGLALAWRRYR